MSCCALIVFGRDEYIVGPECAGFNSFNAVPGASGRLSFLKRREGGVEHFDQKFGVGLGQAHRRGEPDGLAPKAAFAEQQAEVAAGFHDLRAFGLGRFFGRAVLDQFHAQQQALAAHVADDVVLGLQLFQPGHDEAADLERVGLEIFALDDFQHGFALRADDRVAAKGVEMNALRQGRRDLRRRHDRRQRTAVADALGHGDDVGNDALRFKSPIMRARAAEARLHFVRDAHAAGGADVFVGMFQIAVGKDDAAADALDGFGDEAGHAARRWRSQSDFSRRRRSFSRRRRPCGPTARDTDRGDGVMHAETVRAH